MQRIKDIFENEIDRRIEEVIKVDQADEETVRQEIKEYVLTDAIKDHFYMLYDSILDYGTKPHEGIGVWISGFFGSGKSSFAKLLGYSLANSQIKGKAAAERFSENAKDDRIKNYLQNITARYNINAVIFDVSMDRGVRTASDRITEVMYKILLRQLGYPEDFDLAEMEMMLETEGKLEEFVNRYNNKYGKEWKKHKQISTSALNEASNILNEMYPDRYATKDSWLHAIGKEGRADIDPNKLARLTFELVQRRHPGYGIIYIIDEVGQYVAKSTDKMLDLQAIVQALGRESKNRINVGKAKIPAWIFVTSQEKLDEVVDALDAKRIELARLKDRFPLEVDLKQSDIKEVTAKRVLDKTVTAEKMLGELYDKYEGRIKTNTSLERTYRNSSVSRDDFVNLYPYLPYQIDLSISIVSGLRTKRGAQRHVGGSNRTIIKQAQQMLIHPQTNLADKPVGSLVTLDMIYELLYGGSLLPVELTQEIDKIKEYLPRDVMALKVAKSIALLEVVRDLPNTINNIAAVLHPSVEAESIKSEVKTAIQKLQDAQFIRETQEGYKLLTVQEKHWDTQRRGYDPKPRNVIEIIEEIINNIYVEPSLKAFRYKNISTFKVGIILRDRSIADGSVNLNMYYSDTVGEFQAMVDRTKRESREKMNEIYWLFSLTEEIHNQITDLFRSKSMISEYSRLQSQSQISREEMACLEDERQRERERIMPRLKSLLLKAIESGCSVFRGVEKDANLHGPKLADIQRSMLSTYIPQIYEKLEMGARNLSGNEVEAVFNETRLNRLTPVFYDGDEGLQLITKQGDRYVPNTNAPVAKEIMEYINNQNAYGNTVTGKTLETHFNSPPYGWERDVLRLVLSVLFRAGHLEMISQGQKYKDYNSPSAKVPLVNNTTFRSTTFSPKKSINVTALVNATKHYEDITGHNIDVDEATIAEKFKHLAEEDYSIVHELLLKLKTYQLPGIEELQGFQSDLEMIRKSASDDAVTYLEGNGASYKKSHSLIKRLQKDITDKSLETLKNGRNAANALWRNLHDLGINGDLEEKATELGSLYENLDLFNHINTINELSNSIYSAYRQTYEKQHDNRNAAIKAAIESLKANERFAMLTEPEQEGILQDFNKRFCENINISWDGTCHSCNATVQKLESDILSISGLQDKANSRILELTKSDEEEIVAVSTGKYLRGNYRDVDEFHDDLEQFKTAVEKLILEGKKVYFK